MTCKNSRKESKEAQVEDREREGEEALRLRYSTLLYFVEFACVTTVKFRTNHFVCAPPTPTSSSNPPPHSPSISISFALIYAASVL